jgi:glycosyltransferase involved in cell wall biosynthesis
MASSLLLNSNPAPTSVCYIVRDLGHYHDARLEGAARRTALDVSVIEMCNRSKYPAFDRAPSDGCGYERYTLFPGRMFKDIPLRDLRSALASKLTLLAPQVLAVPGWSSPEALASLGWAAGNSVPVIVLSESQRHDYPRTVLGEILKRRLLPLCSAALVGGSRHADYAADLGLANDNIFTGYDIVDNEHFRTGAEKARNDRALRARLELPAEFFLTCSRFVYEKNLVRLLEAYARYCASCSAPWGLVMLGAGPLKDEVEATIRRLQLEKRVVTPGYIPYDSIPPYYGLAGAFILPSVIEPWGLVVNEAMAARLPVVVSNLCGSAADLVQEGRNGFTFDPSSVEQLADLLLKVSRLPQDQRDAMGRAGQEIIGRWSPELFGENLEKAMQAALAAPRPSVSALDRAVLWLLIHRRH